LCHGLFTTRKASPITAPCIRNFNRGDVFKIYGWYCWEVNLVIYILNYIKLTASHSCYNDGFEKEFMNSTKFKTSFKCAGCVAKATPFLNEAIGETNWQVDINSPSKVLTVNTTVDDKKVIDAVEKAGYKAERIPATV
jgi:copper chaperone